MNIDEKRIELLRDRFAGAALSGLLAWPGNDSAWLLTDDIVNKAWEYADKMIEARKRTKGKRAK